MPEEKKPTTEPKKADEAAKTTAPSEKKPGEMRSDLGQKAEAKPTAATPVTQSPEKKVPAFAENKEADQTVKTAEVKPSTANVQKSEEKPAPADAAKKPDAPVKPVEGKPAPAEAAKKPDAPAKPAEGKPVPAKAVKKPDASAKPAEGKPAPAEAAKKPDASAKPVENQPSQNETLKKPTEPAKPSEPPKKAEDPKKAPAADPQKKQEDKGKAGAAGLGLAITQIFADRLDYPDEKAMKSLPVPKENEGFSMRLHPAYFHEFLDHPFSVNREVKDYKDLYESIRDNGISEPVLARPGKNGGLEVISGHRRHDIARQLNYPVPVVIRQIDDDTAQIAVVDGNLHRQDIPTSELARAAKMKMDALARKAGRRSKMEQLTAPQKRTDQIVGEDMGMSRNQVQRLVRIDSLVPELKQQVDEKKLPFNTAVELSYLKPEEQAQVVDVMKREQVTPSMAQATQLKEASRNAATMAKITPSLAASHKVDEKKVSQIIKPKADPPRKVTLTELELKAYFPSPLPSAPEIKQTVFEALSMRNKAFAKQASKDAAKKAIKPVR